MKKKRWINLLVRQQNIRRCETSQKICSRMHYVCITTNEGKRMFGGNKGVMELWNEIVKRSEKLCTPVHTDGEGASDSFFISTAKTSGSKSKKIAWRSVTKTSASDKNTETTKIPLAVEREWRWNCCQINYHCQIQSQNNC